MAAFVVGSLVFFLLVVAVFVGLAAGRPWLGGVTMMSVGLAALGFVLYRR